jgi:hypothetical protein
MTRVTLAIFGLLSLSYGDTLTLRDGTTVTGSWLGASGDRIDFQVGNRGVQFLRSNVAQVTFSGNRPAMASSPKPVAPEVTEPKVTPLQKPLNVVHFWDPNGSLAAIERASVTRVAASPGVSATWEIIGARSTFRIKRSPTLLFLVRLPDGVDPNKMQLIRLSGSAVRKPYTTPETSNPWRTAPLSITKAGDSYGLAPVGELTEGEYAFIRAGSNEAYCFGIDPAR